MSKKLGKLALHQKLRETVRQNPLITIRHAGMLNHLSSSTSNILINDMIERGELCFQWIGQAKALRLPESGNK